MNSLHVEILGAEIGQYLGADIENDSSLTISISNRGACTSMTISPNKQGIENMKCIINSISKWIDEVKTSC